MITNEKYYLITCNDWFVAPDGEEYRAAWGKCSVIEAKDQFGFVPLRPSTNWFCKVGIDDKSIIIAGCHIHYAIECSQRPNKRPETYIHEVTKVLMVANKIYFAE